MTDTATVGTNTVTIAGTTLPDTTQCDWCCGTMSLVDVHRRDGRRMIEFMGHVTDDSAFLCERCWNRWWDIREGKKVTWYYLVESVRPEHQGTFEHDGMKLLAFDDEQSRRERIHDAQGMKDFIQFEREELIPYAERVEPQEYRHRVTITVDVTSTGRSYSHGADHAWRLAEQLKPAVAQYFGGEAHVEVEAR